MILTTATLPGTPLTDLKLLPPCSAIYFVTSDQGEILYCGKAKNLQRRWSQHNKLQSLKDAGATKVGWIECNEENLESIEASMIYFFEPKFNKQKALLAEEMD